MKKIIFIAFAAILAGLAISCQKEELVSEKTDAVQYTFNITVNDQFGFDNDSSTKGGGSVAYKSAWDDGDRIFLFFKPANGSLLTDTYATLKYNKSAWSGSVKGSTSLGGGGTLSAVYVFKLGDVEPKYSDTDGQWTIPTGNVFYNCQIGVEYSVSGSEISATLDLVAPDDFVRFTIYGTTGNTLTCNTVKGWNDVVIGSEMTFSNATCTGYMTGFNNIGNSMYKDFYGRIVSGNSLKGKDCEFSVVNNGNVYERTANPNTDARSFSMSVTGTNPWTEAPDKLPGLFSVEQGRPVRFSKGNLYAKDEGTVGSPNWKWHFYDKQYEFLAADMAVSGSTNNPQRTVSSDETEIDLFTWGFSASTSLLPTGDTYVEEHTTTGDLQLVYNKSSSDSEKKGDDWGVAYCESNSLAVGTWRTLSTEEWQYLFNTRSKASSLYKSGVTVCGKTKCVVLLPDYWVWNASTVGEDWQKNTSDIFEYSEETAIKWSTMEAAGAVCLPAAGCREGSSVKYVGNSYYWSSTVVNDARAYFVFNTTNISASGARKSGYSVRLVTDIK